VFIPICVVCTRLTLHQPQMSSIAARRLRKELVEINTDGGCPVGSCDSDSTIVVSLHISYRLALGINLLKAEDFETWLISVEVMGESLYQVSPKPLDR
jgi:ubiquitin-conjugating enzyme E2 W